MLKSLNTQNNSQKSGGLSLTKGILKEGEGKFAAEGMAEGTHQRV